MCVCVCVCACVCVCLCVCAHYGAILSILPEYKLSACIFFFFFSFFQIWRDIYMIVITVLTVSTLWFQLHPHFFTSRWYYTRMTVYVGLAAYGVMPTLHWIYLNGGVSSPIVQARQGIF